MAHFAEIDENNIVTNVIVAEQEFINTLSGTWIQTSYNTLGGVHRLGGTPLRKNYAGIGYTYDSVRDAFVAPKPVIENVIITFNEDTCQWDITE
jgi:hypothetical protein